jgi:hypothetical protein
MQSRVVFQSDLHTPAREIAEQFNATISLRASLAIFFALRIR